MIDRALLGVAPTRSPADEPTLDRLLAEPIVHQLMRRDRIDAAPNRVILRTRVTPEGKHSSITAEFSVGEGETVDFVLSCGASHLPIRRLPALQRDSEASAWPTLNAP
jgi:hypothetical protein